VNIKSWDGSKFFYPDAKNADNIDSRDSTDFASSAHQHVKAAITDFAHAYTHKIGGTDVLTPADIGALSLAGGALTGKLILAAGISNGIWFPNGATSDTAGMYLATKTGEDIELTIAVTNDAADTINLKTPSIDGVLVNGNKVWNAGNFNPANYSLTTHNHTYNVNDPWLRFSNDSSHVRLYGNSRQMAFRTDGVARYSDVIDDCPFVWMYGGDAAANRIMMLTSGGNLWTPTTGWLSDAFGNKTDKTSAARPGVTKLYRNDDNSDFSVQTAWTGTYWMLRGYNGDKFHAECQVGYASNADLVDGIHAGSFVRTDAPSIWTLSTNSNGSSYYDAIQIRELNSAGAQTDSWATAPRLAFHWSGRVASQIALRSDGAICILNNPGNGYEKFQASQVYGAVYNDYAEYRQSKSDIKPGCIVVEDGNGFVIQSNGRLQKCPMVVSDTFGFAIGKQEIESEYSLPIAVSGRVLVYTDKPREQFKAGDVVCTGKNGTVSKMKFWEKVLFPDRILGTVSEVPTYETWGSNNIAVDKRIWIKVS
jgi:hypothetical protein